MITVHDDKGVARYKIVAVDDLNYQIHKWVPEHKAEKANKYRKEGDLVPAKWEALQCFPNTFDYALKVVYEKMVREDLMKPERGFKAAVAHAKTIADLVCEIRETKLDEIN